MPNEKKAIGDEIAAICIKCKEPRVHTIFSVVQGRIAKIQCKTCESLHRYRSANRPLKSRGRRLGKSTPQDVWEKMVSKVTAQKRIPYTFSGHFKVNDLIEHNTFGLGVVTHLLPDDKIQVIFKDGEKILVSSR